jgi:hypothetical protein
MNEVPQRLVYDSLGRVACEECGRFGYIDQRRYSVTKNGRWLCPRHWLKAEKGVELPEYIQ